MWDDLSVDNNSFDWIAEALQNGTAIVVADGSYHWDRAPLISGTGWILYCFRTKRQITGPFYEKSNVASSYRRELLGLHALHVLLHAIESYYELGKSPVLIWCDNKGDLSASKRHHKQVPTGKKHSDILRALQAVRRQNSTNHNYFHMFAHHDNITNWLDLPLETQLNCICDSLAKSAVHHSLVAPSHGGRQTLPFETVAVYVGGEKQTQDVNTELRFQMGRVHAREIGIHPTTSSTPLYSTLLTGLA